MVVGLDHAINKIAEEALDILGDDTVIIVSSDNGGSVWFGGMNAPFRSGKLNPFEGGVRVPAFAVDLSKDKKYLGKEGREFKNMIHISDWLPTFLSWSDSTHLGKDIKFDGIDQSKVQIKKKNKFDSIGYKEISSLGIANLSITLSFLIQVLKRIGRCSS